MSKGPAAVQRRERGDALLAMAYQGSLPEVLTPEEALMLVRALLRSIQSRNFDYQDHLSALSIIASHAHLSASALEKFCRRVPMNAFAGGVCLDIALHPNLGPAGASELVMRFWESGRGSAFVDPRLWSQRTLWFQALCGAENPLVCSMASLLSLWEEDVPYRFRVLFEKVAQSPAQMEVLTALARDARSRHTPGQPPSGPLNKTARDILDQSQLLVDA